MIDPILNAPLFHPFSARPVYLQEKAQAYRNGQDVTPPSVSGTLEAWRHRQETERDRIRRVEQHPMPPERPPKKPHLRSSSSRESTPPPGTPSRGHTPSRSSSSSSSRVNTPVLYSRSSSFQHASKPKCPTPPSSPAPLLKARSPTPPPPPSPLLRGNTPPNLCDLPLPPPPALLEDHYQPPPNLPPLPLELSAQRICDSPKGKDSPLSPHHGMEGKYRRTSSPSVCSTPNVKPSVNLSSNPLSRSPVRTPKRESPATIAAKGAPGWEKFLGGKTSTLQFTSEEVSKLKQQREEMAAVTAQPMARNLPPATPPKPPPKPKVNVPSLDGPPQPSSAFHSPRGVKGGFLPQTTRVMSPTNANIGLSPIHASKSSPSLNQATPTHPPSLEGGPASGESHRARGMKKRHHHNHGWKNSLESLRVPQHSNNDSHGEASPSRGFIAVSSPPQSRTPGGTNTDLFHSAPPPGVNHSHSNSDSGLSSLSGRTSTMSPISTMSTVSSVSSASSSGSSSRNSLRSASIVSSCTIPLDEEDEQLLSTHSSPSGTMKTEYQRGPASLSPVKLSGGKRRPSLAKEKLPEEVECEELSRAFLAQLPANSDHSSQKKLKSLFGVPGDAKTSADYIDGLFDFDLSESESQIHQQRFQKNLSPAMLKNRIEVLHNENKKLSSCSIAESKARFLRDVSNASQADIQSKKELLLSRISRKIDILKGEQVTLKAETKLNEDLGREISVQVMQTAQPNECDKFKLHLEEIDKISSLIFGLSGRLARAENAMLCLSNDCDDKEKEILSRKRDKLADQLSEAKKLKDNIDKRSKLVGDMLRKYLKDSTFRDYEVYVKMKTRLILESREIQEKIALGEEQSLALKDAI
eukprot:maker-scaffold316_size209483-snap-gene-1.28 protein:Tk05933 transcript:maker-scaffold316_size209483-snap-gene-1.28-mRNA-1 annotation:"protein shroom"